MEFPNNKSPYKVLKLIDGSDILCKVIQVFDDAIVCEAPMAITKQTINERRDHIIEHTGLEKWMSFTNDINFVIDKHKILTSADLSPEVTLYYKMIAKKSKEESAEEQAEDGNKTEEELLDRLRNNIDRLTVLMEGDDSGNTEEVIQEDGTKRILH